MDARTLQSALDAALAASGALGAQVSVADASGVTSVAAGIADDRTGAPLTTETPVQVGSIAKLLTGVLVHQLVEEGALDLDAPVRDVLPEFRVGDEHSTATMTPRHLLSMTSGLEFGWYLEHGDGDDAADRMFADMADEPVVFAPGEGFLYSGLSTVISSRIVARQRGTTWEEALSSRILSPLGLTHTGTAVPPTLDPAPGHDVAADGTVSALPDMFLRATAANGTSIVSTAADLASIARSLLGFGPAVLSPEAVARMQQSEVAVGAHLVADAFALGPYRRTATLDDGSAVTVMGHGGRWAGGVCDVLWVPERGVALAITTNTPNRAGALILDLYDRLLPELVGAGSVVHTEIVSLSDDELALYAGHYATPTSDVHVSVRDGGLDIEVARTPIPGNLFALPPGTLRVFPVGEHRFMPEQSTPIERRLQEVWFAVVDGRATFFYDGFPGARRA